MKNSEYKCGGYPALIAVPTTVEEYDKLAKVAGAALDAAIDHEVYHGTLGDMREAAIELISEVHGVARRDLGTGVFETEVVDGKETKVEVTKPEKFDVFLARVATEKKLEGDKPFGDIFKRLSAGGDKEVKFDPSVRPKGEGKGLKLANRWRDLSLAYITGGEYNGKKKVLANMVSAIKKTLGKDWAPAVGVEPTSTVNVESLGWLIKEWFEAQAAP